jgi:predicted Zn-dependent protease
MRHKPRPSLRAVCQAAMLVGLMLALPLAPAQTGSSLPTLGDAGEMSLSAERQLGDSIAREIYRDPDYVDDPLLTEYLQQIWQPLLAAARARGELTPDLDERFAWQIMLIRDRTINAFALPGGYLGVHLGLIGLAGSRDELASVLGHEMSHVTQRHISRLMSQQSKQAPWIMAAMILGALAIRKSPDAANAAIAGSQAISAQTQLNFSRDMEREADRVGYGVMTQAGFDGQGFVGLFSKLQQANRINDNGGFPYLRSHPLTTERIADAQLRVQSQRLNDAVQPRLVAPGSDMADALLAARARVLTDPGVDALREWLSEADASGFAALSAARQGGVLYAAAMSAARLRDQAQSAVMLQRLERLAATDVPAERISRLLAVELAQQQGRAAQALALMAPAGDARPEFLLRSQLRIQTGEAALASSDLQTWVARFPKDAAAWSMLATAWTALGQPVRAVRAEAESRVIEFDYSAAVDRLKAAQEMLRRMPGARQAGPQGTNDFIDASIVDTRTRQVQSLLHEQTLQR